MKDLEDFAASPNNENGGATTSKPLLDQVLDLFQRLNYHMAEQEQSCPTWGDFFLASKPQEDKLSASATSNESSSQPPSSPTEISVVFGGKFSKNPASISEKLVSKLVLRSQTVYTISRSICEKVELPTNVKHIPKQNLDASDGSSNGGSSIGSDEFYDVMSMAKDEWLKTSSNQQPGSPSTTMTLVFYFTLGQHKGVNPFVRNLNSAQNFHRALQKLSLPSASLPPNATNTLTKRNWRVVVTGTDATLPSTHPPSKMTMKSDEDRNSDATKAIVLTVPTYKIGTNNFVYAMSKLGQYYWITNAVARLLMVQNGEEDKGLYEEIVRETDEIFQKIRKHVTEAGEDGAYHGGSYESDRISNKTTRISMKELDAISLKISSLLGEGFLQDHFRIAEQISICYTPLHAKPWSEDAIQSTSNGTYLQTSSIPSAPQKAFILEQIVKRFKNAISIESAASSHFL